MKAKLIKTGESFLLKDVNNETLAITSGTIQGRMLSAKNCETIERGYDLNEEMSKLVDKKAEQNNTIDLNSYGQGCLDAFQKALELMGDKKFSEEDIHEAYSLGEREDRSGFHGLLNSKQQTEWDVEIEMDILNEYDKPKLDEDGCLILKTI